MRVDALLAELSVCLCVCQSIHLYLSQLIHSLYHVHISSRSLCHFYPSTPALPSDEVHVWSAADHLCRLYFSVLTPDILSEREIERWRAGGAVCHENPGLCNL